MNATKNPRFANINRTLISFRRTSMLFVVLALTLWHWRTTGGIDLRVLAVLVGFVTLCMAYGKLFLWSIERLFTNKAGVALQFLVGFVIFNSLLFALTLISPLGVPVSLVSLVLMAVLIIVTIPARPVESANRIEFSTSVAIVISGVAATLWCQDVQQGPLTVHDSNIYQVWQDVFFHVRQISSLAYSRGAHTIQDIVASSSPARVYHYGSYISAAAISLVSGTSALDIYAAFSLPFGIFVAGLAAFCLAASIWGGWAGLTACTAILLLPDAYQQGFGNRYLSYNFLSQVNFGMLYGLACASLAWIFLLDGCRRSEIRLVALSYGFLALCLLYKAHIFVAISFPIFVYPALFFKTLPPSKRVLYFFILVSVYLIAIYAFQRSPRVPVMRLDGSGISSYTVQLLSDYDSGKLKDFFTQKLRIEDTPRYLKVIYTSAMLLVSTFGVWLLALVLIVGMRIRSLERSDIAFPIITLLVYLIMSMGLASDSRGVGTTDELLNRPLVWAYFALTVWVSGSWYFMLFGDTPPRSAYSKVLYFGVILIGLAVPLVIAKNLQTFPTRTGFASYQNFNSVPSCLVSVARFIRENSAPYDLIQSSNRDRRFFLTALSERQSYVGANMFREESAEQSKRFDLLRAIEAESDPRKVAIDLRALDISWYVLSPGDRVNWPNAMLSQAVLRCGDFRVFKITSLKG